GEAVEAQILDRLPVGRAGIARLGDELQVGEVEISIDAGGELGGRVDRAALVTGRLGVGVGVGLGVGVARIAGPGLGDRAAGLAARARLGGGILGAPEQRERETQG